MHKIIIIVVGLCFIQLFAPASYAEVEKFDIVTYSAPKGWGMEKGTDTLQFTKEDKANKTFCIVTVYRSMDAGPDSRANFLAAWKALVTDTFKSPAQPQIGTPGSKDGWMAEVGLAPVNTEEMKGAAMLTTMTGGSKMVNVLVLTNSDSFTKEIETIVDSIKLPRLQAASSQGTATPPTATPTRLIGKWNRSGSVHPTYADPVSWGTAGYTTSRYEFKADGTYLHTERSFRMMMENIIVVKETGKYSVSGDTLTLTPSKSVISSYKKAGGVDALGPLVRSQNRDLETVAYKFTFHYFEGIQEWNLVLQADKITQRDGQFSNNTTFPNAWYFDQKFTDNDLTAPKIH